MWRFTKHEPSQPIRDPIEGEFFQQEDDDRTARHLVRESIQNSLDAKIDGEQVKVRFTFGKLSDIPSFRLYAGLKRHLEAPRNGLNNPPGPEDGVRFLTIEDFGTFGLTGNTAQVADTETVEENRFYYFWRNVARTGKGKGTLGTWGLGKTVFPASSQINTFIGLTNRFGETDSHLMGMTVIKSHQLGGTQYDPYGYYARWTERTPFPITDEAAIREFQNNFHIERRKGQSGLSIVIPHIVEEFTVEMLRREVTEHYFWPILKGDLVVEIQEDVSTDPEHYIDRQHLISEIELARNTNIDRELSDTIELGLWASSDPAPHARVFQPSSGPAADWESATWSAKGLESLIERVEGNEPFAVRIGVRFENLSGGNQVHFANLYVKPVSYNVQRNSYFCRQGINVSNACRANPFHFVCLIVVEKGELANLLSTSENPSHTSFGMTDALRDDYPRGTLQTIQFLRRAPQAVARLISERDLETDGGLFADVFWKPAKDRIVKPEPKPDNGDDTDPPPPPPPPPPRIPAYDLRQSTDGFGVSDNPNYEDSLEYVDIRVGYASTSGNAIKNHSPWDFDFANPSRSSISISVAGCKWKVIESNHIRLFEIQREFEINVKGFDNRRDLAVTVRSRKVPD